MLDTTRSVREVQRRLDELLKQDRSFTETATAALDLGAEFLCADHGYLAVTETQSNHWESVVTSRGGDELATQVADLSETYCRKTITESEQIALHNAPDQGFADDPAFETFGQHCYLGTPLLVDGEEYGTVCFVAADPRETPFADSELLVANLITRLLGYELESAQRDQQLRTQQNLTTVLNRILRHNLRNNMTVIRGFAAEICSDHPDQHDAEPRLFDSIDQLIELGEKARELEAAFDETASPQSTDMDALVAYCLKTVEAAYDVGSVSLDSESVTASVRPSFETALTELLENAAKHGGETPTITVGIERTPRSIIIEITDDGPGLPKQEQAVLTNEVETPLVHGSGLGIWLAYWIVTTHGGDLESTVTDAGTTMRISLPHGSDDTERGRTSRLPELLRSRDQYRAAFEEATEAMVIADDDGQIIDANAAASTVYNAETESLLGRSLAAFVPESFEFETVWASFRATGSVRDTLTVPRAAGQQQTYEYIGTADIVPGQHLLIVHDITARVRREAELRMKTRAMDKAPVGITISNPVAEDNPLVYVNERFCEQSGYDESELLGENCRFMQGDATDPERVDEIRQLVADRNAGAVTLRNYRKDGSMFWNHLTVAPVRNDNGKLLNYVGFQQDFTSLVKRERKLETLQKNLSVWRNSR